MTPSQFFDYLWQDYTSVTPQAEVIRCLFADLETSGSGAVVNDHVAFRTFADTPLQLSRLEPQILALGYQPQADYQFEAKKLRARSYIHHDETVPKIFLSELLTDRLSESAQALLKPYTDQISGICRDPSVFWSGLHWRAPRFEDYQALMQESEYAAWLLAMGLRANHFTVSVNHLNESLKDSDGRPLTGSERLQRVITRVKQAGFQINADGGEIKGSPQVLLEQAATLADEQWLEFAGGESHPISTCFYEFALRYPDADGTLYQGFVEANADRIFSSTTTLVPKKP